MSIHRDQILSMLRQSDVLQVNASPLLTEFDSDAEMLMFRWEGAQESCGIDVELSALDQAWVDEGCIHTRDIMGEAVTIHAFRLAPPQPASSLAVEESRLASVFDAEQQVLEQRAPETPGEASVADLFRIWRSRNERVDAYIKENHAGDMEVCERFGESHHWPEVLVRPIARAWERLGWFEKVEVLGPFGIGAHISLHCYTCVSDAVPEAVVTLGSNLFPDEGDTVLYALDMNSDNGAYEPGTTGHINNLHRNILSVPDNTAIGDWVTWSVLLTRAK